MQSKHDKLFVSSPIYMENINNKKIDKTTNIRLSVIARIDSILKEKEYLKQAPFLWVGLIEYFGDYQKRKIELKKIDKKYGDLQVRILIPIQELKDLDLDNVELVEAFHLDMYKSVFDKINTKYNLEINLDEYYEKK